MKNFLIEDVEKRGEVPIEEIRNLFVNEKKLCDAPRTVERAIEKLVASGKILKKGKDKILLTLA